MYIYMYIYVYIYMYIYICIYIYYQILPHVFIGDFQLELSLINFFGTEQIWPVVIVRVGTPIRRTWPMGLGIRFRMNMESSDPSSDCPVSTEFFIDKWWFPEMEVP